MYLSVIPTTPFWDRSPLIYYASDEFASQIVIGSLVSISISTRITTGIIVMRESPIGDLDPDQILSIISVLCSTPLLDTQAITLILSYAQEQYLPLYQVLTLFLPKSVITFLEKRNFSVLQLDSLHDSRERETSSPTHTIELYHHQVVDRELL